MLTFNNLFSLFLSSLSVSYLAYFIIEFRSKLKVKGLHLDLKQDIS